ncbi:MAG: hypothetical protein H0W87_10255, partial [Actinobacteria bacterium]|nr:hypothetical protein [Actinomycetota bacterium]
MSFRARLTLVAAAAVALAIVVASFVVYFVVRGQLLRSVDDALRTRQVEILNEPREGLFLAPGPDFGVQGYVQLLTPSRCIARGGEPCLIPVTEGARGVAQGQKREYFSEVSVSHTPLRVLTFPYVSGTAVQVARPLTEVDRSLSRIRWYLILIAAGGIAVAAG